MYTVHNNIDVTNPTLPSHLSKAPYVTNFIFAFAFNKFLISDNILILYIFWNHFVISSVSIFSHILVSSTAKQSELFYRGNVTSVLIFNCSSLKLWPGQKKREIDVKWLIKTCHIMSWNCREWFFRYTQHFPISLEFFSKKENTWNCNNVYNGISNFQLVNTKENTKLTSHIHISLHCI